MRLAVLVVFLALVATPAPALSPSPGSALQAAAPTADPPVPRLAWELGSLRSLNLRRKIGIDFLLRYTVAVPAGTAERYSVSIEICRWIPVAGAIPDQIDSCSSTGNIPLASLAASEDGTLYSGLFRTGYDPSQLTYGKINRFSYTLNLHLIDAPDPNAVILSQELNDVIFTTGKKSGTKVEAE